MRARSLGLFVLLGATLAAPIANAEPFRVNHQPGLGPFVPLVEKVLREAGLEPTFFEEPPARLMPSLSSGEFEGQFFRAAQALNGSANVLKIDVPLYQITFVAVTTDPTITIKQASDLSAYNVAYVRGNTVVRALLGDGPRTEPVNDRTAVFKMIEGQRVPIGIVALTDLPFLESVVPLRGMRVLQPPLSQTYLYFLVNKSQAAIVPTLTKTFQKWVKSGAWDKELNAILANL